MSERQTFRLVHAAARAGATHAVKTAPDGFVCVVRPPSRSLDQNAKIHAMLADIVAAKAKWADREWDLDAWKAIMVSAHNVATKGERSWSIIQGLEGEPVSIRESTASMSRERGASLIEYIEAWCAGHGIQLREPS